MITHALKSIACFYRYGSLTRPCTFAAMGDVVEKSTPIIAIKETKFVKKPRYDGRIKKRQWVTDRDRGNDTWRTDKRQCLEADRVKRKKVIILFGYSGVGYFGMQRNPEMKTIEEDLVSAMHTAGFITQEAFNQVQNIQFQRAARTDKGVSAARQVVSLKLPEEANITDINKLLPEQIRLFAIKRVTKGFNAKTQCDARSYSYILPTISFASHTDSVQQDTYRLSDERRQAVNDVLKMYEGSKNFHNFTSRKYYHDPSSRRVIKSFECGDLFISDNVEFAILKVKGQSFMLHQIRKMVGLALAVIRGHTAPDTIDRSWTEDRLDIPMAPGLGLVLDQVHYDGYNERYGSDGMHEPLSWEKEETEIQAFADNFIYPTIVKTEISEKPMLLWLETLPWHSYDIRDEDKKKSDSPGKESESENDSDSDKTIIVKHDNISDVTVIQQTVLKEAVIEQTVIEQAVLEEAVIEQTVIQQTVLEEAVIEQAVSEEAVVEQTVINVDKQS